MALLPREHGAYGQCAIPLLTAFVVAGATVTSVLIALTVVAGFLAHEPATVLLGTRGRQAATLPGPRAMAWLAACVTFASASGVAALMLMPPGARWSLLVPAVPAAALVALTIRRREKSVAGEVAGALAFAGAAVPMIIAAGEPLRSAAAVAIPFATLFIAGTFAVRTVIVAVRGGGDAAAVTRMRWSLVVLVVGVTAFMVASTRAGMLPQGALIAVLPGLGLSVAIATRPPAAARLRLIGWSLVAASVLTAALAATVVS